MIHDDERQITHEDTWTPLAEATGGRLLEVEGADHHGPARHPVQFNPVLRAFAESCSGAGAMLPPAC